jgi:predicted ATP-grasp superfamily ATP-dependent carboligase
MRKSTDNSKGTVFLADAISPRSLAICRSLGGRGVRVTCADESPFNLAFFSRYCQERKTYPSPLHSPQNFIEHLLNFLTRHPKDCLISVKDESLDAILAHREKFEQLTHLPFPPTPIFQIFRDKNKTMELAAQIGISHPKTLLPTDLCQVKELALSLRAPQLIKPRMSCSGLGIYYIQDMTQLYATYCQVHEQYPFPMIQDEIPQGDKFDVACLLDEKSRPLATFVQKEIRSFPLRDGASTVQESVWRPDLVDLAVQLLQKAGWSGIAEVEFMIDPRDGTPQLLEVNPRFWGSVQLAIQSGVDFPYMLYEWSLGRPVQPVHSYKVGQFCRQLLPYDLMHFFANPNRFRMQPSFFNFFDHNCAHNIFSASDPVPVLGFFLSCSRYLFDPDKWLHLARMEEFASRIGKILRRKPKTSSSVVLNEPIKSNLADGFIEPSSHHRISEMKTRPRKQKSALSEFAGQDPRN